MFTFNPYIAYVTTCLDLNTFVQLGSYLWDIKWFQQISIMLNKTLKPLIKKTASSIIMMHSINATNLKLISHEVNLNGISWIQN